MAEAIDIFLSNISDRSLYVLTYFFGLLFLSLFALKFLFFKWLKYLSGWSEEVQYFEILTLFYIFIYYLM